MHIYPRNVKPSPNMTSVDLPTPNHPSLPWRSRTTVIVQHNNTLPLLSFITIRCTLPLWTLTTSWKEQSITTRFSAEPWGPGLQSERPASGAASSRGVSHGHPALGSSPTPPLPHTPSRGSTTCSSDALTPASAQSPAVAAGALLIPSRRSGTLQKSNQDSSVQRWQERKRAPSPEDKGKKCSKSNLQKKRA